MCCLLLKLSCGRRIISNIFRKTFSRLINHLNIKATGGVRSHKIHIFPKKQLFWIYASFLEYFDGHRRFTVLLNQFVFQDDFSLQNWKHLDYSVSSLNPGMSQNPLKDTTWFEKIWSWLKLQLVESKSFLCRHIWSFLSIFKMLFRKP